jgi:endo-1,4-beta-xylanase
MAAAPALPPTAGLNAHAARAGLVFGAATTAENQRQPACRAVYEQEVGLITTDIDLKFGSLRPTPETWAFGPADALIGWARSTGLRVRGHTLVWNEANPDWLKRCSSREIARIFDEHIERVVSRYAGRIEVWDVVNEPFWPDSGEPGGYRPGPWYYALGPDYIPRALKRARAIDPNVKLCINEANCEAETRWGQTVRPCLARLVDDLRQRGVPLDAVGLQAHLQPNQPYDDQHTVAFMQGLASHKLDLHITELDVDDTGWPDEIAARDQLVARRTGAFLDAVLTVPAVTMVVTWELQDPESWYVLRVLADNSTATRLPRPLPLAGGGIRKPMWHAMARSFDKRAAA